ncbi:MAG TPA: BON domain-containing protein [Arachidicoccus sp.]
MIAKKFIPTLFIAGTMMMALPACKHKPTDAEIQTSVQSAIANYSGITADVKDGVVTLSGSVASADDKANIESAVNGLTKVGVKSLTDNISVTPPAAPSQITSSPDDSLATAVKDATKDFPGINATVSGGIITVTGELEKSKVLILKQALDALHPKKTDMTALKVK